MKKHFLIVFIFQLIVWPIFGQDTFTGSAPKYVKPGQRFEVKYVANEKISDIQLPEQSEVSFIGGPYTSTFSSTNIINGKVEQKTEYTYTYVAQINEPGKYTIQPVKAKIKRNWVESNSITLEVINQAQRPQSSSAPNMFFKMVPNKRSAYIGEPVRIDAKIYTKVQINNITGLEEPDFNGFYKETLETEALRNLEEEKVGDEIYYSGVVASYLLIPQKSGDLVINSTVMQVTTPQKRSRNNDPFGMFFDSPFSSQRVNLNSDQVKLRVKELPDPKPRNYSGAVGYYSWKTSANESNITTNDAISLQFIIKGNGNLKLLGDLKPEYPAVFSGLEPQIKQNIKATRSGYTGTKTYTYTLIPQSAGNFNIPEQKFVYFDPAKKKYITLSSPKYPVSVAKGEEEEGITVISGVEKEDVQYIGKEIRFIKTGLTKFLNAEDFLFGKKYLFMLYLLGFVSVAIILIARTITQKGRADVTAYKNRKASETARKRLKIANKLLHGDNAETFYAELSKALWGYLSDKLSIPLSEFTMEKAVDQLTALNISADLTDQLMAVSTTCEMARYAPSQVADKLEDTYNNTRACIISLEENLR